MSFIEICKKYGIGLTGGIATGKTTVADILVSLDYRVFDADKISREVVEPGTSTLAQIVQNFGGTILNNDGTLNRKKMRELIFSDSKKRRLLETIVHPAISDRLEKILRKEGIFSSQRFWFYEAALLVETKSYLQFNSLWVTTCDQETQIGRLIKRDNITRADALKIIQTQASNEERLKLASFVLDTGQSVPTLTQKIKAAMRDLEAGRSVPSV